MAINVNSSINLTTGEKVIIFRTYKGSFDRITGLKTPGREITIKAIASVQTPKPGEMDFYTGAEREVDRKVFYVKGKKVYAASDLDGIEADILKWHDQQFKVVKIGEWDAYGFTKAYAYRIK